MDFSKIRGHEKAVSMLGHALGKKTLPHSFIFQGPSGVGKKLTATVFAKALNCLDDKGMKPCGKCENCTQLHTPYTFHPDIRVYRNVSEKLWIGRREMIDAVSKKDKSGALSLREYMDALKLMEESGLIFLGERLNDYDACADSVILNQEILFTKDKTDNSFCIDNQAVEKYCEKLVRESLLASSLLRQLVSMYIYSYKERLPIGNRGIRGIIRDIYLKPNSGRRKVFIIDNAHNITEEAADALLKTLEEPPANSVLVLITSKPSGLLQTIRSRCETIGFPLLAKEDFFEIMEKILPAGKDFIEEVYPFSAGSPGTALNMLSFDTGEVKKFAARILAKDFRKREFSLSSLSGEYGFLSQGADPEGVRVSLNCFRRIIRDIIFYAKGAREGLSLDEKELEVLMPRSENDEKRLEKIFFLSCSLSGKLNYNFNSQLMIEDFLCKISAL